MLDLMPETVNLDPNEDFAFPEVIFDSESTTESLTVTLLLGAGAPKTSKMQF